MQEFGGIQLARMFSTVLAKGGHCDREDCNPCRSQAEKKTNCNVIVKMWHLQQRGRDCSQAYGRKQQSNQKEGNLNRQDYPYPP